MINGDMNSMLAHSNADTLQELMPVEDLNINGNEVESVQPIIQSDEGEEQVELSLEDILTTVNKHFAATPSIADGTEVCIAAVCSLLLADTEGCIALVLEGPASTGKTTVLKFFRTSSMQDGELVVVTDNFTPASFVSHAANRNKKTLADIDLLPRIKHKVLVVADLAPFLSSEKDDLEAKIGVLTRVLDGQGYESDSGAQGHRGYSGDYRFTLLAATTPMMPRAWDAMGRLGNRILIEEIGSEPVTPDDLVAAMRYEVNYSDKVFFCAKVVSEFLLRLFEDSGGYGSIAWRGAEDDETLQGVIAKVASWAVKCRGTITVGGTNSEEDEGHMTPHIESPYRLNSLLYSLAKGHAVACGRRMLATTDVQLAVRVGLESMPGDRRQVIRALLREEEGRLTSGQVEAALSQSRPTARKAMRSLGALGAVDLKKEGQGLIISLRDEERWLLEDSHKWVLARIP